MNTRDQFLDEVETFLADAGISPSRFGRETVGDPNFVIDLRAGRNPSLLTADKVRRAIARYRSTALYDAAMRSAGMEGAA